MWAREKRRRVVRVEDCIREIHCFKGRFFSEPIRIHDSFRDCFFFFLFFSLFLLLLEKFLFFWRGETTERPRIFIYSHDFRMHFMKPKYFINLLIRCNKFKYIYLFIHLFSVSLIFEIIYLYNIRRKSSLN